MKSITARLSKIAKKQTIFSNEVIIMSSFWQHALIHTVMITGIVVIEYINISPGVSDKRFTWRTLETVSPYSNS